MFFITILNICCLFSACGQDSTNMQKNSKKAVHETARYHRIVAATPAMEEIVLGLVEPEQMAAVSNYSRNTKFTRVAEKARKIKGIISEKPSTESIIAQKPDIVLLPVVFGRTQAETLKECGLRIVPLDVPEGYENIKKRIQFVAEQLGETENGKKLTAKMDSKINAVKAAVKNVPRKKIAVGYTIHGVFGRKNGAFDSICTEAGVVNGAADYIQHRGNQLSKEQILKIDPDVIICSVDAVDSKMLQEILHDPSFQDLKAIKDKKVFSIEERYMYNTTQYFADAVEVMAKTVYPECFQ